MALCPQTIVESKQPNSVLFRMKCPQSLLTSGSGMLRHSCPSPHPPLHLQAASLPAPLAPLHSAHFPPLLPVPRPLLPHPCPVPQQEPPPTTPPHTSPSPPSACASPVPSSCAGTPPAQHNNMHKGVGTRRRDTQHSQQPCHCLLPPTSAPPPASSSFVPHALHPPVTQHASNIPFPSLPSPYSGHPTHCQQYPIPSPPFPLPPPPKHTCSCSFLCCIQSNAFLTTQHDHDRTAQANPTSLPLASLSTQLWPTPYLSLSLLPPFRAHLLLLLPLVYSRRCFPDHPTPTELRPTPYVSRFPPSPLQAHLLLQLPLALRLQPLLLRLHPHAILGLLQGGSRQSTNT